MPIVKICGLRSTDHALAAINAGADMLGFIFAPSRRQVSADQVTPIALAARTAAQRQVWLVGVFVNETIANIRATVARCNLDAVQLSGDEPLDYAAALAPLTIIKAIRFDGSATEQAWVNSSGLDTRLLVDAHVPGSYGGAGVIADWTRAAELARRHMVLLAGGLTPANVAEAIAQVQPWGVDVSSGVETDGVKDIHKIHAFVAAARSVVQ